MLWEQVSVHRNHDSTMREVVSEFKVSLITRRTSLNRTDNPRLLRQVRLQRSSRSPDFSTEAKRSGETLGGWAVVGDCAHCHDAPTTPPIRRSLHRSREGERKYSRPPHPQQTTPRPDLSECVVEGSWAMTLATFTKLNQFFPLRMDATTKTKQVPPLRYRYGREEAGEPSSARVCCNRFQERSGHASGEAVTKKSRPDGLPIGSTYNFLFAYGRKPTEQPLPNGTP